MACNAAGMATCCTLLAGSIYPRHLITFFPLEAYLLQLQDVDVLLPTPQPFLLEFLKLQEPTLEAHAEYVHYRWQPTRKKMMMLPICLLKTGTYACEISLCGQKLMHNMSISYSAGHSSTLYPGKSP